MYFNVQGSPLNSNPSSGSLSSEETDPNFSRAPKHVPVMEGTNQDTPFPLRVLSRSPSDILEKKAEMNKMCMNNVEDTNEMHNSTEKEVDETSRNLHKLRRF